MKIVVVEDEQLAAERLCKQILELIPEAKIEPPISSVRATRERLSQAPKPDLIFLDIQLSDGLSIEVFQTITPPCPIIFTTAFDTYFLEAFQCNGIDYLLKPIKKSRLADALKKYQRLKSHFTADLQALQQHFREDESRYKSRLLVRKGLEYASMAIEEIAYLFSEYKMTFARNHDGQSFMIEKSLRELEQCLDPKLFYRLNRKYLACIHAVHRFKPLEKGKLQIILRPEPDERVIVSQEKATEFKQWLEQ